MNRINKFLNALIIISLIAAAAFLIWTQFDYNPAEDINVSKYEQDGYLLVGSSGSKTGIIFYQGGKVEEGSYIPLAEKLSGNGYFTVIPKMPFNLAVLGYKEAGDIIEKYENVEHWYIVGHSLGGAMAAQFVEKVGNEKIEGIIFLAAYPSENTDLSDNDIRGLVVYGSNDQILNKDYLNNVRNNFPEGTEFIEIKGANHSQFGNYGFQKNDGESEISRENQQNIVVEKIINFVK